MSEYHRVTKNIPIEYSIIKQNEREIDIVEENKIVEFVKSWQGYSVGEIAGFPTTFANKVIENGFAKKYEPKVTNGSELDEFFKRETPQQVIVTNYVPDTTVEVVSQDAEKVVLEVKETPNETKEVAERPKPKAKEKVSKS